MFFSFLPSEALFPAAFFSSAEAFSPAVLSFPGRSLRPTLGPARCGTRYGVIAAHFQTNLRNSCKNRTPHPLRIAPPPPFSAAARSATPRFTPKPPSPATPDPSSPPPPPAPRLRPPEHPHRPPATRPHRSPLPDTRHPASSPMPPKLLSAHSPPTPPHSSPPPAGTTPRLAPAPAVSPAVFPITAPPQQPTDRVAGQCPLRRLSASRPSLRRHPFFRRHHRRLPLLPPSPAPHLPATAPPPHPLLSKKEEPTRPLFPTKSLSLQNMDGPPAKNARKRGLLPAPFRIFAHLYPRHARKTG